MFRNDTQGSIWRIIASQEMTQESPDGASVQRLANLISAAGIAVAAPGVSHSLPPADVTQARLLNRFRRGQGEHWACSLAQAGIANVAIKGLASAHAFWPDPDGRAVSDADILIASDDLPRALTFFQDHDFRLAEMPTRSRWGFISDASFQPLISNKDGSNIDLHVQAAAWPMRKALPVEEILASAEMTDVTDLRVPDRTHALLIASAHAAGDLFTADAVKSVVDGLLMLRSPADIDFAALRACARRGNMLKPLSVFLALLEQLGADLSLARQAGIDTGAVGGACFRQVVREHLDVFNAAAEPDQMTKLRREWSLSAEMPVFLRRNTRRLFGLVRPNHGSPTPQSR